MGAKDIKVNVIFDDGASRGATITGRAIDTARFAAARMPYLFEGTGFNPLNADAPRIVAVTRADHDFLHGCNRERQQAAFRLGQMDMREAAEQILLDLADGTQGLVCATLIDAAERVRNLQLCEKAEETA